MRNSSQLISMAEAGVAFETVLESSKDFFDAQSYEEVDDVQDAFYAKYRALVSEITSALGVPEFNDGMANPRFPAWCEALFLASWRLNGCTPYVALRHDDKELPFILAIGNRVEQPA